MRESLIHGEGGQDIVEYTLLLAAIALSGVALFLGVGVSVNGLWSIANSRLAAANQAPS